MIVPVREPFPWTALLGYLGARSTPDLETILPDRYIRHNCVTVRYDPATHALLCDGATAAHLARILHLFQPQHDAAPVARALGRCPIVGPRVRALPGLRPPGCWEPFELCLRVILGQQVSVPGARTLMRRLAAECPGLAPETVAQSTLDSVGLTSARRQTIRALAEQVATGNIRFDAPWSATATQLLSIRGIGPWTVRYLAIRLGRNPDAFPDTDLGLLRAAGSISPRELRESAEAWRPYRSYAAMYLWVDKR